MGSALGFSPPLPANVEVPYVLETPERLAEWIASRDYPLPGGVFYVAAFHVTLASGGAEEGGWWYDVGEPLAGVPVSDYHEAVKAFAQLARTLGPDYEGRPGKSSVAGNAADLNICLSERYPRPFPEERPRYE